MRKRGLLLMLPVFALLLAALACGESTPEVKTPETGEMPSTPAEPEGTVPPVGSARSNPAPLGSEVTLGDLTLTVGEVVRPAQHSGVGPEAGHEFVRVTLSVRCEKGKDESCSIYSGWEYLTLVGSAGVTRRQQSRPAGAEFFGGTTITGSLRFEVGQDETNLVLRYEGRAGSAFLALQ